MEEWTVGMKRALVTFEAECCDSRGFWSISAYKSPAWIRFTELAPFPVDGAFQVPDDVAQVRLAIRDVKMRNGPARWNWEWLRGMDLPPWAVGMACPLEPGIRRDVVEMMRKKAQAEALDHRTYAIGAALSEERMTVAEAREELLRIEKYKAEPVKKTSARRVQDFCDAHGIARPPPMGSSASDWWKSIGPSARNELRAAFPELGSPVSEPLDQRFTVGMEVLEVVKLAGLAHLIGRMDLTSARGEVHPDLKSAIGEYLKEWPLERADPMKLSEYLRRWSYNRARKGVVPR